MRCGPTGVVGPFSGFPIKNVGNDRGGQGRAGEGAASHAAFRLHALPWIPAPLCHSRPPLSFPQVSSGNPEQKNQRRAEGGGKARGGAERSEGTWEGQKGGREDMQGSLSVIPDVVYRESSITGVVMQPRASPLCAALRRATGPSITRIRDCHTLPWIPAKNLRE